MTTRSIVTFLFCLALWGAEAYVPSKMPNSLQGPNNCNLSCPLNPSFAIVVAETVPQQVKPLQEVKKAAIGTFAAFTLASSVFVSPNVATASVASPPQLSAFVSSSTTLAEKVTREGVYFDYEIDVKPQAYDDARSTFKPASETKSNKGKYTALLAILIVGSFIIPMAQYFWYVRDDDSSDKFFATKVPEPKEPPKKKWF